MVISNFRAGAVALALGTCAPAVWADKPPLSYDISADRVAIFDLASNGQVYYAVGERGVLLTSPGPVPDAWHSKRLPATESVMSIAFGQDGRGVVVGHGSMILHTADHGTTWAPVDVSEHGRGDPFMDVAYLGNGRFLAVGAFGLVMESVDGGETWQPASISEDYFDRHLYSIARAGDDWLLIGESGSLFVSADGGEQWEKLTSPYEGSFFGGMQTPDGAWLLYGMRGQIWRTEDRGATWQRAKVDIATAINAHETGPEGQVFLFGNGGQVLVSEDDGRHFLPASRSGLPGDITAATRINGEWLVAGTAGVRLWNGQGE
ncbi:YCF48-related protein [Marinobacter sp. F4206]|uniref:YCF48-related protein n=1 Tax=Marinobacter sp. F4206 TaxID=2861777 RepID=UPI001C5ED3A3|nr:YCF48-related protein [Marinobacter sp. F4206]MBW4935407.1 hypothetical protein [Marinobacter sp. F4206]